MAIGDIDGTIASLMFDSSGYDPNIIHIAGSIYATVYQGPGSDGWLKTVSISDDGSTLSTVASLEFDIVSGYYPDIVHVAGSIYAIAYTGPGNDGWLKTVSISDDGLTLSTVASLEFEIVTGIYPEIIHVAGSIYAIVYEGPGSDGWLKTVSISDDGLTLSTVASLEFDTVFCDRPKIIHIAGSIYVIVYGGPGNDGWLKTVSISDDGLTLSTVASLEFDPASGYYPDIIHVAGSIYAIAYRLADWTGWLKTVSISDDGLTLSNVTSFEFDAIVGSEANIINIVSNIYAIVYQGPSAGGWLKTVSISNDGLTMSTVSSYRYDVLEGYDSNIIHITGNTYAVVYWEMAGDGWLRTIGITTSEALAAARNQFTGGLLHRAVH